jgi:hypothetical protein
MNEPEHRTLEHRLNRLERAVRRLQWLVGGAVGVLLLAVAFWIWVRTAPRNEARDRYECYREVKMLGYSPWESKFVNVWQRCMTARGYQGDRMYPEDR